MEQQRSCETSYQEGLQRCYRYCDWKGYITINNKCEAFFYKLGYILAQNAPIIVMFFIVTFGALGLGIYTAVAQNDIYSLWIEKGSRLHGERAWIALHAGASDSRSEYLIISGFGGAEVMTVPTQSSAFELIERALTVNYSDPTQGVLTWHNVCSRPPTPYELIGLMRLSGGAGLPCTKYVPTDCWREGDYDYDVPLTIQGLDSSLADKYKLEPDYKNFSSTQMFAKIGGWGPPSVTGVSCTNWAGVPIPENFMFGGVTRNARNNITQVLSLQFVISTKTPVQMAQWVCNENCTAARGCVTTAGECLDPDFPTISANPAAAASVTGQVPNSCVWNISRVYQPQCAVICEENPVASVGFTACVTNVCLNLNSNASLTCDPTQNPLCESCAAYVYDPTAAPAGSTCSLCLESCALDPVFYGCVETCTEEQFTLCYETCFLGASACEYACQTSEKCLNPSTDDVNHGSDIILGWEQNYINFMAQVRFSYPFEVDYFSERTIDDLTALAGAADSNLIVIGYVAMVVFGMLTLLKFEGFGNHFLSIQSRLFLGCIGMFMVILSVVASLGFSALVGIEFAPTIVQVLPFLALGLGTYDMFVLAFGFHYIPGEPIPHNIGHLLRECGPRISLTAATNIVVFGIGANIPLPAVNLFSGAMCIVILFNYLILVLGFTALIALHAERIRRDRVDCLCCLPSSQKHNNISDEHIPRISSQFAEYVFWWPVKLFIVAATIVIFSVAMWGATIIEIGLPTEDIVPHSHYSYGFLVQRDKYYGAYDSSIFVGYRFGESGYVDYSDKDTIFALLNMEAAMDAVPGTDPTTPLWETSWLDAFLWWCYDNSTGCAEPASSSNPRVTIQRTNSSGLHQTASNGFWPRQDIFNYSIGQFVASTAGLNDAQYLELDIHTGGIISSRILFIQKGLFTDAGVVEYIRRSRDVTDPCPVRCFPGGTLYDLYEQYVHVNQYLNLNLGYTVIGVLSVSLPFLLHPGAVVIMAGTIALCLSECYGYLPFLNLKLNGVSVVNLIMAIGVIVVPTAHITRVFTVTEGTPRERAKHALAKMVFPMLFSTISTFIGELPLAWSRFPYFKLYFFYQYALIGVLTLLISFFPLPLLLEYFGPPPVREAMQKPEYIDPNKDIELPPLEDTTGNVGKDGF